MTVDQIAELAKKELDAAEAAVENSKRLLQEGALVGEGTGAIHLFSLFFKSRCVSMFCLSCRRDETWIISSSSYFTSQPRNVTLGRGINSWKPTCSGIVHGIACTNSFSITSRRTATSSCSRARNRPRTSRSYRSGFRIRGFIISITWTGIRSTSRNIESTLSIRCVFAIILSFCWFYPSTDKIHSHSFREHESILFYRLALFGVHSNMRGTSILLIWRVITKST